jgi:hypothetical protein
MDALILFLVQMTGLRIETQVGVGGRNGVAEVAVMMVVVVVMTMVMMVVGGHVGLVAPV